MPIERDEHAAAIIYLFNIEFAARMAAVAVYTVLQYDLKLPNTREKRETRAKRGVGELFES